MLQKVRKQGIRFWDERTFWHEIIYKSLIPTFGSLMNKIFVNPPPLPLLCEISRALHLAQPGLTAGWQADEIQVNFEIFKVGCRSKYSTCRFV